jgi:UDP-2,3-diacylglucosamine pyrophosphatase LpxH
MTTVENIEYMNTGDFCDSCTAIVETIDGEFRMIRYNEGDFYYGE